MTLSNLYGWLPQDDNRQVLTRSGEILKVVDATFNKVSIPVVFTTGIPGEALRGRVAVDGYLFYNKAAGGTVFRAVKISMAEDHVPTNTVFLSGVICKKNPYFIGENGLESQVMRVEYDVPGSAYKMRVAVTCKDSAARHFKDIPVGTVVHDLCGYLKWKHDHYEVILKRTEYQED